jgi:hypothetical protein
MMSYVAIMAALAAWFFYLAYQALPIGWTTP